MTKLARLKELTELNNALKFEARDEFNRRPVADKAKALVLAKEVGAIDNAALRAITGSP